MDLGSFLGANYTDSEAESVDANGNIIGYATYIPTGIQDAILWSVVPEPGTVTLFALGCAALLLPKRNGFGLWRVVGRKW